MPVTAVQWLSFAAITLCTALMLISRDMVPLGGYPTMRWGLPGSALFFSILLAGWAMPWFLKSFAARNRVDPQSGRGAAVGRWVLLSLLALSVLVRLLGLDVWLETYGVRALVLAGLGLSLAVGYGLFFTVCPVEKQGVQFGAQTFLAFFFPLGIQFAIHIAEMTWRQKQIVTFYVMTVIAVLFVIVAVSGLSLLRADDSGAAVSRPGRFPSKRIAFLLLLALVLFNSLNGIIENSMFWLFMPHNTVLQLVIPCLVGVAYPLAGALMDRNPRKGYRVVVTLCTLICMLAPVSAMLHSSPLFGYFARVAVITVSIAVVNCITVVLARLSRGTGRTSLMVMLPLEVRFFAFLVIAVWNRNATPEPGVLLFITIVIAVAFYSLMIRYEPSLDATDQPDIPPAVLPEPDTSWDENLEEGVAESSPLSSDTVFAQYGFSEREAEIAQYILRGDSTPDIAATLHISENTVNTHVKRLLRKTGLPHRRNLMALFMVDGKSNPKNGDQE